MIFMTGAQMVSLLRKRNSLLFLFSDGYNVAINTRGNLKLTSRSSTSRTGGILCEKGQ